MKLYFYGHDHKYAAEQMLLSLYPNERPEYPDGKPEGDRVELKLSSGKIYTTASCRLVLGGKAFTAKSAVKNALITDDIMRDKLCSKIIKTAFYRAAIAAARPGMTGRALDKIARDVITKGGFGKCFGHSLGHGVGYEIHEAPTASRKSKMVLKPGMCVTIEPGIYLEGNLGVRIEDLVLITETGCEVLSDDAHDGRA